MLTGQLKFSNRINANYMHICKGRVVYITVTKNVLTVEKLLCALPARLYIVKICTNGIF